MLIRKFGKCSIDVKQELFRSYLTTSYCSHLWSNHKKASLKRVTVAYNNVYRALMSIRGACSISNTYVSNTVDSFTVLQRKAAVNFINRIVSSTNLLVQTVVSSLCFLHHSHLHNKWRIMYF